MIDPTVKAGDIFKVRDTGIEVEFVEFDLTDEIRILCVVTGSQGEKHKLYFKADALMFVRRPAKPDESAQPNHPSKIET